jgi:hypothetical protein
MAKARRTTRDETPPAEATAERVQREPVVDDPAPEPSPGAFEDQRDVDPQAVPAVEMLRTVVTLGCVTLDESLVGQALPASAVIRPHGVELTICHAGALELALPAVAAPESEVPATSSDTVSLDALREVAWLMGPARLPRSAIFGRALHDLRAVSEAAAQTNDSVCLRIQREGPHHLRPEIVAALIALDTSDDSSKPSTSLAGLLKRAMDYLAVPGWLARRAMPRGGSYLQGKGIEVFDGFPAWSRPDQETPALVRPGRRRRASTNTTADHPNETPGSEAPS